MLRLTSILTYVLSFLNICHGSLLITCKPNYNYFLFHNCMGNPVYLSIMLKYYISISPEAVDFIKLLFLYLTFFLQNEPF